MTTLSDTQDMLARAVDAMLEKRHSTDPLTKGDVAPDLWPQMIELGLTSAELPETAGGLNLEFREIAPALERIGHALARTHLIEYAIMGGWLLAASEAPLSSQMIPDVAAGNIKIALAHGEPGTAGDLRYTMTTAHSTGNDWSISGNKSVVIGGADATHFMLPARISQPESDLSSEAEIGLFLVSAKSQNLVRTPYRLFDGSDAADVLLENVSLPPQFLLCRGQRALQLVEGALDRGRAALCQEAVGLMEALQALTLDYVKTREQFDQPIGAFQTMQHRMADMFMELELVRSAAQLASRAIDCEQGNVRMRLISAAMVTICESANRFGQSAIQAHGGIGMTQEYLAGHYFKRLTLISRWLGDADQHLDRYLDLEPAD
jgi:alkylation response protein AidB-like acyl-CoA dehydrogenase